jgi:hypothetical protein
MGVLWGQLPLRGRSVCCLSASWRHVDLHRGELASDWELHVRIPGLGIHNTELPG